LWGRRHTSKRISRPCPPCWSGDNALTTSYEPGSRPLTDMM
jgi:hypothetical protein